MAASARPRYTGPMLAIETINTNDSNCDPHTAARLRACEALTFPACRFLLREPDGKTLVAVAARFHDQESPPATDSGGATYDPIGFALGWGGPRGEFELVSLYTAPLLRGMGVGGRLLERVEEGFAELGYTRGFHFYTVSDDDPGFTRFLTARGWSAPVIREIICKSTLELAGETPWLMRARLPAGFTVKPWGQVTTAERAAIAARQKRDNPQGCENQWYADDQDPFIYEENCHPGTSLALMDSSEVAGWVLTHVPQDTKGFLRWTVSFVSPEIQGFGRILPLWREVALRQAEFPELQRFTWGVPVTHPRMTAFARRRMKPWLSWMGYACTSFKDVEFKGGASKT